jgi:hypothetical protein
MAEMNRPPIAQRRSSAWILFNSAVSFSILVSISASAFWADDSPSVSSTLGETRCRSPNTVSRSPGVGIIAGWDDLLHFVDYERTALGCFDGGVGCGAQESGQSEQSSDLDFLGIGQCFDLIDTESVSTASNLVSSNDRRAGTFATDQHRQGIVQNITGRQISAEASLSGKSRVVATYVLLTRSEPPPATYAHHPDPGDPATAAVLAERSCRTGSCLTCSATIWLGGGSVVRLD